MAKTYSLISTSMMGGTRGDWNDGYWKQYSLAGNTGSVKRIGYSTYSKLYETTYITFDATQLADLRTKNIVSVRLTLTVKTGTIPGDGTQSYPIGYKRNSEVGATSANNAWARGNAAGTADEYSTAGWVRNPESGGGPISADNTQIVIDLGTTVPAYGYTIGPNNSGIRTQLELGDSATLTVVTNETDYTLSLIYNANGGYNAPATQTKTVTTSGTPSATFSISASIPSRANSSAGSYTVAYDANGGSVSPEYSVASRTASYTFLSWNTASGGGGTSYAPSNQITISTDTTIYAQWSSVVSTDSIVFPTATRGGYTFSGWFTAASGGAKIGDGGESYVPSSNIVLYAQWTANVVAPTFTTQPSSAVVYRGSLTSLNVSATTTQGTISYQWQYSATSSGTYTNIAGATLSFYYAPTSDVGTAYYRCVATATKDGVSASTTSNSAYVTVSATPSPVITEQPSSVTVSVGASAVLSLSATSSAGDIYYQWDVIDDGQWVPISGATNSSYSAPTSSTGTTYYVCQVANILNGYGAYANSAFVYVTVSLSAPSFTVHPSGGTAFIGDSFTLTASATAPYGVITYQWQSSTNGSSWQNISGATSTNYSVPTQSANMTYFRCAATATYNGVASTTYSNVASVSIIALTGPTFVLNPQSANYAIGADANAMTVSVESNGTVYYQWQVSDDNTNWSNITGAGSTAYVPPTDQAGEKYYRCYTAAVGGSQTKTAYSSVATIRVSTASDPVFTFDLSTVDVTYNAGDNATVLNGSATVSVGVISYQWYKSTDSKATWYPISGATSATYQPPTTDGGTAYYRVIATNIVGDSSVAATSNAAKITVRNVILNYDAKWSQYINNVGKPFVKLARLDFLNPNGSVLFTLDNNPTNEKSGAFIQSGELSVNLQNGSRRSATITLSNLDGDFDYNVNKLWFGQQVRLWEGMILPNGSDFYISQGVFYVKDPDEVFEPGLRQTTLNLVDKWAYLDGTLFGNLEGTYEVPVNSNIFNVIQSVLNFDRGNGQKIDASAPIFTSYYNGKTTTLPDGSTVPLTNTPYTYRCDGENGTYADIVLEMNTMLAGWIGYDANGQLRLDPSQDDILDTEKPVQWRFSPNNSTFLGATYSVKNSEVYNDIIIVGESLSDYGQTAGRATNYDPKSDTNVNIIGLKTKRYQQAGYYTQDICESLAVFKLKRESVLKKSVSIKCGQLFHLQENNLVTIERTDKTGNPIERHLITGYTRPIAQNGDMIINATSTMDSPVATITTAP